MMPIVRQCPLSPTNNHSIITPITSLLADMLEEELDLLGVSQDAGLFELAQERSGGVELELPERLERVGLDRHHLPETTGR